MMRAPPTLYRPDPGAARPPLIGGHQPPNEPPQKPTSTTAMSAASTTVLPAPPPPVQVGGQRMALKLATQPKQQQQQSAVTQPHRWPQPPPPPTPPPLGGAHSIQHSPIQRHPIHNVYVAGCQAPECQRAAEDDELLLSDSNCSCSNSLECLVSSQHSPGVGAGGGHLYHSQATSDTTTTTFMNHPPPTTFHLQQQHHRQRPIHSPPTPPPPPQPLIGQNTYTATSDTITDSMLESAGVHHHRLHLPHHQHPHPHPHQAASMSQTSSDFAQVAPAPNYHTMSLGRHHQHHHQPHPASHQHQHLMDHHQSHLHHQHHQHQQQHHLGSMKQINGNPNAPANQANKARQTVSFRRAQTSLDQAKNGNNNNNNNNIKANQQQEELDDNKQQPSGGSHRQRAGGPSNPKDNSETTASKQQRPQARTHPGDQFQRLHTCPTPPGVQGAPGGPVQGASVAMGAAAVGATHHQLQHQNNVAIYPSQTPLAPVGGATSLSPPAGGRVSAHLLADSFDGPIGSPLGPITSHRTNSPWMRISSIILTPVGIVIVLFIVVSPLLHYLM